MNLASEKGALCLYTTLPLETHGFTFRSKRDFRDITRMRYRKRIDGLPSECPCGAPYSLDHSQVCKTGGFIHMRHDDECRLFAYEARKVFNDVEVEPHLQPTNGEIFHYKSANKKLDARSDVRIRGFWSRKRNTFFDFKVFYPFARSYRSQTPSKLYKLAANTKRREYQQRIAIVENADFTPMIMSSSGGMGTQMSSAIRRLAMKIA